MYCLSEIVRLRLERFGNPWKKMEGNVLLLRQDHKVEVNHVLGKTRYKVGWFVGVTILRIEFLDVVL